MKDKLNIVAVGAGGVASYLFPALQRSFDLTGLLIDGDRLEEHNLDRQLFHPKDVGNFKADALIKHLKLKRRLVAHNTYLTDDAMHQEHFNPETAPNFILCMVDNHPARRAAIKLADHLHCGIIIAANEYATSQVIYYHPDLGPQAHPFNRYPELETSEEGSPVNCQGEAAESSPQLAIANQVSAALTNFMVYLWNEPTIEGHKPVEFQTTFGALQTITVADL